MNRLLLAVVVVLGVGLLLALWRIDHVTTDRDLARATANQQQARADSLRNTLNLTRELADEQSAIAGNYQKELNNAKTERDGLLDCLARGTCGLRVNATCVRDGAAPAAGSGIDAGTPRLTAPAERDYSALQEGIAQQRAQIIGLQQTLVSLHSRCRIGK
ncbi:lysis system i-spanin subunit Rz [Ectopseudomonas alcaliphila]|uniref:Lysis system i-spanin subunit Rz n=1 Tax=Ectopseudomonas alcaliphila TaxID=101564 RepID=A0A1G7JHI4_9GAMM|nr:lysis system i-spanin subunit Rz [Pseudomonas alcaliphila]MDX5990482.1 lysis system i-spanin subunit Rz [Pseudomonas alcaliphila]MDX5995497.1 lysis system i-spanin subunit Rz [Pseudomonas alcaliphila]SDF24397.1 prophage endopeptidase [Pseudomonas alcaliphila]